MGITKKDAEKHLEKLARRRARYAERKKKVAATPRAPEQLTLFPMPPRAFVMTTAKEQAEFDLKQRNLGREWIKQILAKMEE